MTDTELPFWIPDSWTFRALLVLFAGGVGAAGWRVDPFVGIFLPFLAWFAAMTAYHYRRTVA